MHFYARNVQQPVESGDFPSVSLLPELYFQKSFVEVVSSVYAFYLSWIVFTWIVYGLHLLLVQNTLSTNQSCSCLLLSGVIRYKYYNSHFHSGTKNATATERLV